MAFADIKRISLNTPKGVAKWPKLTEPDYGTASFPKPDGEYSTKLVWNESDPAFQKFKQKMAPYYAAAEAKAQAEFDALKKPQRDKLGSLTMNPLFTPVYDEDENPTGQVEMKVKMTASGTTKFGPRKGKQWSRKPDLYDALGRKITKPVDIWGGSEIIVSFSFADGGYFIPGSGAAGLGLKLEAVQIVTLRQGGERTAESHGFKAEAGGFSADDLADDTADSTTDDEFAGGSNDDAHLPGEPSGTADF